MVITSNHSHLYHKLYTRFPSSRWRAGLMKAAAADDNSRKFYLLFKPVIEDV